jgi:hypothetical protein
VIVLTASHLYYVFEAVSLGFGKSQCTNLHLANFEEHKQTIAPWLTATPAYRQAGATTG